MTWSGTTNDRTGVRTSAMARFDACKKSQGICFLLWMVTGPMGGHRFYLGQTATGAAIMILTLLSIPLYGQAIGFATTAIVSIWVLLDGTRIGAMTRAYNDRMAKLLL